jgi:aspartyl-tRNA(Asn)/glutamyl-tRNA(Gln) amidotransferase subunit A
MPEGYEAYTKEWEEKIHAFIEFDPRRASQGQERPGPEGKSLPQGNPPQGSPPRSPLVGLPVGVTDAIAVEGFSLTCGSKLLQGLQAPYTATVVKKLIAAGACPVGKTNLDEFAMGSSTDNSGIQRTNNPWDPRRVPGGSSGGSAAAVAAGLVPFALGSDTGGSVRQPAAFCGVPGLKPTYGAVSRFGLVAYASSLECIGILADRVERCREVFRVIRGADPWDQTSREAPPGAGLLGGASQAAKGGTAPGERSGKQGGAASPTGPGVIGVLSPEAVARALVREGTVHRDGSMTRDGRVKEEAVKSGDQQAALQFAAQAAELEPEVRRGFEKAKEGLRALGYTLREVELPSLKYGVPAYYTIATAEASANLARFDSIRYGKRPAWAENPDELIDQAREAGFGPEVKLRILLGTFVLRSGFQDRYYLRAQRIRAGIRANFEALLGDSEYQAPEPPPCSAILLPVFPIRAFDRGPSSLSPFAQKAADLYTCCANLAGLPALSFPASVEGGLPVGVQIIGRAFAEETLLDIAAAYEGACPIGHPPGYRNFWG